MVNAIHGATSAKYMHNDHILSAFDVMNPIYCSLQDRFASSHGNNHGPLQEISELPALFALRGLQDGCAIETAVQDLRGEWARRRPRAFGGVR